MPLRNAVQVLQYKVLGTKGSNACAVTYNPEKQLYYTAFAGNSAYPLEVFDTKGQNRYTGAAGVDLRSLWYNPKKHNLQGLGYPRRGLFNITLDDAGLPAAVKPSNDSIAAIPNTQSTAGWDGKGALLFFDGQWLYRFSMGLKQKKKFVPQSIPGDMANLNNTTVVYTGVKGYELGFYDSFEGKVYFTDLKGAYTGTSMLPASAPRAESFRFSFANGLVWLFNGNERTWFAYRVF